MFKLNVALQGSMIQFGLIVNKPAGYRYHETTTLHLTLLIRAIHRCQD